MHIQPLEDRVLVERLESEEKTDSGIVIPDSAQEKPQKGIVRATGPGKVGEDGDRIPLQVSEGDTVVFGKYTGNEITLQGEEHIIMRESELLAILEE
ncbi:MAG: co-chaperone GroES [Bradymonadaceae bacterium]